MTTQTELDAISRGIAVRTRDAIGEFQARAPRTQQQEKRVLGMSDLGGCREKIRATVAGDPKRPPQHHIKWAAAIGTAVGDFVEGAMKSVHGAETQRRVRLTLPRTGIVVSGSTDVIDGKRLVDYKAKNMLDETRKEGASLQHLVQISGYLTALIAEGALPEDATASLVYLDRSGTEDMPHVVTITATQARSYVDEAEERLIDVQKALAKGESQGYLRDQAESLCWYTSCGFYTACWGNEAYQPGRLIEHPEEIAAMRDYRDARLAKKAAEAKMNDAKVRLGSNQETPVSGSSEEFLLSWKLRENSQSGRISGTIDLRERRRGPAISESVSPK